MNKIFRNSIFCTILFVMPAALFAQNGVVNKKPVLKIGIFAPLYLDSVFNNNSYKYRRTVPRFIMPAVDFVQGALLALDSLQHGEDFISASIYDTKSYTQKVPDLIRNKKLDSLQLIIGSVKDEEYLQLAQFALQRNIPFISATYPNDGGITGNPFLVIMNSTLKAHCDAIYSYILQNHGTDKIYLFRQPGSQEDLVASFIKQINEQDGNPLLPIETVNFNASPNADMLRSKLDSNRNSIIIGGSLDENFAAGVAKAAAEIHKSYPIKLIGMPNWDNFSALYNKKEMADFPVHFTTPFYHDRTDRFSLSLTSAYHARYKGKPSDMAYKGYESVFLFTKLLAAYPDNFISRINESPVKVFCEYNFRPVKLGDETSIPDYFENKHLYLVKILNGSIIKEK